MSSRRRTVRTVSAAAVVLLALGGVLWSVTSRAGRNSASFGVTVRVLPHCDETRHGAPFETADGRMVCVYPRIHKGDAGDDAQSNSDVSFSKAQDDTDGAHVIRTIEY